jgi:hypothetical protein
MQILETALAFAMTMLVLSLICSSFVEIIHRIFSMREAGLKYVLGQLFDQVLARHLKSEDVAKLAKDWKLPDVANLDPKALLEAVRASFVVRMSSNRAPMGVTPNATPTSDTESSPTPPSEASSPKPPSFKDRVAGLWQRVSLWSGRDLTSLTPTEFMERLGSMDVGKTLKEVNDAANTEAQKVGAAAAGAVDAILTDVAQKFEAFGKEASSYFEGRARLLSVTVAIVLAFAINIDAVELFKTFLRDPAVRASVIEQMEAVTAQQREAAARAQSIPAANTPEEVEKLKKDLRDEIAKTQKTVAQLSELGVPIGWDKAKMTLIPFPRLPICKNQEGVTREIARGETCLAVERQVRDWLGALKLFGSLLLGGILVGLGGPFWYNAVSGLANIRNIAREMTGAGTTAGAPVSAAQPPGQPPVQALGGPDRAQPTTPVGAFNVARAAATPAEGQQP